MGTRGRRSLGTPLAAVAFFALVLAGSIALTAQRSQEQEQDVQVEQRRRLLQNSGTAPAAAPAAGVSVSNMTTALLLLKAAIDPNNKLSSWTPATSYCTWQGVQCDSSGAPRVLDLANLGLQGQMPLDSSVWTSLDMLRVIDVSGNNVTGYVPPQIMEVGGLTNLSLANNGLQGPLPSQLSDNITSLSTRGNQLTGSIPATWGNYTSLRIVDVSNNQLSGNLPTSWSELQSARYLNFSANNLGGQIPSSWRISSSNNGTVDQGMTELQFIGFGGNPQLCTSSENGGSFLYPNAYNLPCSAPNVISLAPPPAPAESPAQAQSPSQTPRSAAPAIEVPVSSPAAAPVIDLITPGLLLLGPAGSPEALLGPGPSLLPLLGPGSAPQPSASPSTAPGPGASPAAAPGPGLNTSPASSPKRLPELLPSPGSQPSTAPLAAPTGEPVASPTAGTPAPALSPEQLAALELSPSSQPSTAPLAAPSLSPAAEPSISPSSALPVSPVAAPGPNAAPALSPEQLAALELSPSSQPSAAPLAAPSLSPAAEPSISPGSALPVSPVAAPGPNAAPALSPEQLAALELSPSSQPSAAPLAAPSLSPAAEPSISPSSALIVSPVAAPGPNAAPPPSPELLAPELGPGLHPARSAPQAAPSLIPSAEPIGFPSGSPAAAPAPKTAPALSPVQLFALYPSVQSSTAPLPVLGLSPAAEPNASPAAAPGPGNAPAFSPVQLLELTPSPSILPSTVPVATPSLSPAAEPSFPNATTPSFGLSAAPSPVLLLSGPTPVAVAAPNAGNMPGPGPTVLPFQPAFSITPVAAAPGREGGPPAVPSACYKPSSVPVDQPSRVLIVARRSVMQQLAPSEAAQAFLEARPSSHQPPFFNSTPAATGPAQLKAARRNLCDCCRLAPAPKLSSSAPSPSLLPLPILSVNGPSPQPLSPELSPGETLAPGAAPAQSPELSPAAAPSPELLSPEQGPAAAPSPELLSPEVGPAAVPSPELLSPEQGPAAAPSPELLSPEQGPAAAPSPELLSPELGPVPAPYPGFFAPESIPAAAPSPEPSSPELSPTVAPAPGPGGVPILPILPLGSAPSPGPEFAPGLAPTPEIAEVPGPSPTTAAAPGPAPEVAEVPGPAPALVLPALSVPVPGPAKVPAASPLQAPTPGPVKIPQVASPLQAPTPSPEAATVAPVPTPSENVTLILPLVPAPAPTVAVPTVSGTPALVPVSALGSVVASPPSYSGNQSAVTTVNFNPNELTPPPPPSIPTSGVTTNLSVTGATSQQFQALQKNFTAIIANITGQPSNYVNIRSVTGGGSQPAATGRRLLALVTLHRQLLQSNNALNISTFIASNDPTSTSQKYNDSVSNGSLRTALQAIGLDLVGTPTITAQGSPVSAQPPAIPVAPGSGHSAGYYLVRVLPAVLGGLLAILLVALIAFCCLRRKRSQKGGLRPSASTAQPGSPIFDEAPGSSRGRGVAKPTPTRGGNTTLAEGLMFSHKPNPIFDTNETQSSRGDDYEVINLTNGGTARHGSGTSIAGMSGLSATDLRWGAATIDPPVGDAGLGYRQPLSGDSGMSSEMGGAAALKTRDALSHPEREDISGGTGDSFTSAGARRRGGPQYDSGLSYRSAVGPSADTQRTAATNDAFVSPHDSPRSHRSETSFNSIRSQDRSFRTAGSFTTARSAQTEFFDAASRGESFDYDSYMADVAGGAAGVALAGRRPPPIRDQTTNPLYRDEEMYDGGGHPILDNPIFMSNNSTPRSQSPMHGAGDLASHPVTASGDVASVGGHPVTMSGGTNIVDSGDMQPYSVEGHPITVSGGSIMGSGAMGGDRSIEGHPITVSGGSIMDSGGLQGIRTAYPDGDPADHAGGYVGPEGIQGVSSAPDTPAPTPRDAYGRPITMSGGRYMASEPGQGGRSLSGHPITVSGGSIMESGSMPGSVQGYPITMSGGSIMDSGNLQAIHTEPVNRSGRFYSGGTSITGSDGIEGMQSAPETRAPSSPTTSSSGHPLTGSAGRSMEYEPIPEDREVSHPTTTSSSGLRSPEMGIPPYPGLSGTSSSGRGTVGVRSAPETGPVGSPLYSGSDVRGSVGADGVVSAPDTRPESLNEHPITVSGGSSIPASFQGHPVQLSDGSIVDSATLPPGVEGHPITLSGGSIMDSAPSSVRGHPVQLSDGSIVYSSYLPPESLQGHPVTMSGGSIMNSGGMGSTRGHPVQLSDGTIVDSGSQQGHPVTMSGGSVMESGGLPGSVQGHPVTASGGSGMSSGFNHPAGFPATHSSESYDGRRGTSSSSPSQIADPPLISTHRPFFKAGLASRETTSTDPAETHRVNMALRSAPAEREQYEPPPSTAGFGIHSEQSPFTNYQTPPGSTVTRSVTRNVESSQQSVRSRQVFDFEGQQMQPTQEDPGGFHYNPDQAMAPEDSGDEYTGPEIDHPHMRSSLDSERGVPFISGVHSPTDSSPGQISASGLDSYPEQPASVQGHPISGSNLNSYAGSGGIPASVQGHPITGSDLESLTGSGVPRSLQGHPLTGSGLESLPGSAPQSVRGHPLTGSGLETTRNSGGSVQGHPLTGSSLMGSDLRSIQGHPVTSSGGIESIQGHPVTSSGGVGSLQGFPITGSSLMGSSIMGSNLESAQGEIPASVQGHPVTYSGGSDLFSSAGMGGDAPGRAGYPRDDREQEAALGSGPTGDELARAGGYGIHTDTHNPVYGTGTSIDAEEGDTPQHYGGRNPIFSSTGAFTSEGSPHPASMASGQQARSNSDIWESGRGSRLADVDRQGSLQGHSINPMFGTHVSTGELFDSDERPQENPLYDSRRSPSSAGFTSTETDQPSQSRSRTSGRQVSEQDNPAYGNESLMDTIDTIGENNPLFDSTTGRRISADRGQRNALFGSDILDSLETSNKESMATGEQRSRNPLFDSSNRTPQTGGSTGTSTLLGDTSSSSDQQRQQQGLTPPSQQAGTGSGGGRGRGGSGAKSGGGFFSNLFKGANK